MAEVNGFCVLVTITAASTTLSITSTRPLSTVTMEEASTCEATALSVSPDGKVVLFFLDQGLGQLTRVEPATGNCRSLERELSCNII